MGACACHLWQLGDLAGCRVWCHAGASTHVGQQDHPPVAFTTPVWHLRYQLPSPPAATPLQALAVNGSSVARFRGGPADLAVEDLTLALDSAACCSSQLCALPALRTLRLHHAGGGWLEHATADRLAGVLAAAARAPAVNRVMLCWALGSTVQRFADLQEAIRELGRGANPVSVQQLGVMEHVVPQVV